jgi:hypothetical protein
MARIVPAWASANKPPQYWFVSSKRVCSMRKCFAEWDSRCFSSIPILWIFKTLRCNLKITPLICLDVSHFDPCWRNSFNAFWWISTVSPVMKNREIDPSHFLPLAAPPIRIPGQAGPTCRQWHGGHWDHRDPYVLWFEQETPINLVVKNMVSTVNMPNQSSDYNSLPLLLTHQFIIM